jgi:putative ABC transport system permease protein
LGIRRRMILLLFLTEGALLGFFGGAFGAGVGYAIVRAAGFRGIPFKSPGTQGTMPMYPSAELDFVLMVIAVSAIGSIVAALYPAVKASRMRPVEALRSS